MPGDPDFETPGGYWPYRMLKELARLPHEFDTFLWKGHTVPNGDPPQPYGPNTPAVGRDHRADADPPPTTR